MKGEGAGGGWGVGGWGACGAVIITQFYVIEFCCSGTSYAITESGWEFGATVEKKTVDSAIASIIVVVVIIVVIREVVRPSVMAKFQSLKPKG